MIRPKILIIGGDDVHARIPLMNRLRDDYDFAAVGASPKLAERFAAAGYPYHNYHLDRRVNPVADLRSIWQLTQIFRREQPALIHAFDTKPGVWSAIAGQMASVPRKVGTVTGLGGALYGNGIKTAIVRHSYETLQKVACRLCDQTIFQNHTDQQECIEKGIVAADRARVILGSGIPTEAYRRDAVSPEQITQLRQELGIDPDSVVVMMISRILRSKGVIEFARSARLLRSAYPNTRFLLVGGTDNDSYDPLTSEEEAEARQTVDWLGRRRDVNALLALADIFVLPTYYREGIPRVLLEAAAMELPLITTDSPGCNEVVADGVNGILVPMRDVDALSHALGQLVENPDLRRHYGRIGRKRIQQRFDLSIVTAATHTTYAELLTNQSLSPLTKT